MRIYVLITQMRPMKVYLFKEGIVRFSSDRYDTSSLGNMYSHLTNSSINKYAPTNISDNNGNTGLKWSFDMLRTYFLHNGLDYEHMWLRIETIIKLTLINLCNVVPDLKCCFELLGFDILIDQHMKPWLLEVNSSPAMSMDSDVDAIVKPQLIKDTLALNEFESYSSFHEKLKKPTNKQSNLRAGLHQAKAFFAKRAEANSKQSVSRQGTANANNRNKNDDSFETPVIVNKGQGKHSRLL